MTEHNILPTNEDFSVDKMNKEAENSAFRTGMIIFGASIVTIAYSLFTASQIGAWQMYFLAGMTVVMAVATFTAMRTIRTGNIKAGVWMMIIGLFIMALIVTLLISNIGLTAGLSTVVFTFIIVNKTLPPKDIRQALIASITVATVGVILSSIKLEYRLLVPELQNLFLVILAAAVLLTGYFIARQAWAGSLRNKLQVAFISVVVVSTGVLAVFAASVTNNILQQNLERELSSISLRRAISIGDLLNEQINTLITLSLDNILQQAVKRENQTYEGSDAVAIQATLDAKDAQWRAADQANNNADPLVQERLTSDVALDLLEYKESFPNNAEVFITDVYGGLAGSTDRTSDYYQADEDWWQAAYNNGKGAVFIGNPAFDESTGQLGVQIALPIHDQETGELIGVLRTTYVMTALRTILAANIGETGRADLYIPGDTVTYINQTGFEEAEPGLLEQLQAAGQGKVELVYEGSLSVITQAQVSSLENNADIENLDWTVVFHQDRDEVFKPVNAQIQNFLIIILIVIALAAAAAFGVSGYLVRPISELTQTAEEVSAGNLGSRAEVTTTDEIGTLATAFNAMTSQLQNTLQGLEQRVADRTRNIELAAEVGRSVSQVRELHTMLEDACELIQNEFDLYYVQVYLTNPSLTTLELEAGTGEVGMQLLERRHSLPLSAASINGRAALERSSVVIPDTAQSTTFHSNPLLPETRGEMAVPLIVGSRTVGVLDMQSREPDVLTNEILPAFEALAGQLAVAIQNANLLEEAQQARADVEAQARRQIRSDWASHLDSIHRPQKIGYLFDHDTVTSFAELEDEHLPTEGESLSAPIELIGEELGSLVVELDEGQQNEQNSELVEIVARQVAQQIENLRLLEEAERYRQESEETARRQTREGWQRYIASRDKEMLKYSYDLNEVRPNANAENGQAMFTLPLRARDEEVGSLAVQGIAPEDENSIQLVNTIAERLSEHIEGLRLFEETKQGQLELDKRAQQLSTVANISTATSTIQDTEEMLATLVHLTQRGFGLYHAHVFTYHENTDDLQIVACGYREGDEHEGTHGTAPIPLSQGQSLVARAGRTRKPVIVNDVQNEPGWLPNAFLPETRAELAVPMIVGDQLMGVLDIQSEHLNAFTEQDANIQLTLAAQVAIALQNAYSFENAQKQAERETMLNTIGQKIQSATSVEAVLQIAARELGQALGAPMTIAQLSIKDQEEND